MLRSLLCCVAIHCLCCAALRAEGEPAPLHQRIDLAIARGNADFEAAAAPVCTDAEFLRRVTLDLTGAIPSAAEAREFLADAAPDKRAKLIDRLLASPAYATHMRNVFDVLLMERREDRHVRQAAWQEFLRASFAANQPWDALVRDIVSADGADPARRPAAAFYLNRLGEPHLLTRDIGRLFLGTNFQCAQCHDHPRITHYKQDHYYGIYAFLSRSYLFADPKTKQAVLAEKGEGAVTFVSVFDPAKAIKSTGPRMPQGGPLPEPTVEKGKEYASPPSPNGRPVPVYSRRSQLAAALTGPENVQFRRNIANRLWALLMGRGLVHPLDMDHPNNPPSHPELLAKLADELLATKYDMRGFLRELALSKTYQRSSQQPADKEHGADTFAVGLLKPLSPEQLAWSLLRATGHLDAERQSPLGQRLSASAFEDRMAKQAAPLVRSFALPAGQDPAQSFQATTGQALLLANGDLLHGWLTERPGNLPYRLAALREPAAVADELFLSVLTRLPTAEERAAVEEFLAARQAERPAALRDLAWALLASSEFRFNH